MDLRWVSRCFLNVKMRILPKRIFGTASTCWHSIGCTVPHAQNTRIRWNKWNYFITVFARLHKEQLWANQILMWLFFNFDLKERVKPMIIA